MKNNVAVLLTCHNRREKTLACLGTLSAAALNCDIYLVDDGSTDETAKYIKKEFPNVVIINGNGNLYWSRGMYVAWEKAICTGEYDFFLWLNDDLELYPHFFAELMECFSIAKKDCIISGIIEDFGKKEIIYGGYGKNKKLLTPTGNLQNITYMNGNVVLVPKAVVSRIGIIDPVFHHGGGDIDYGFTARENGIEIFTTRICVAKGYKNDFCRVRKWNVSVFTRFKVLYSPVGTPPGIEFYFRKKHFGLTNAILYYIFLHFINILSDSLIKLIWGNKYVDK